MSDGPVGGLGPASDTLSGGVAAADYKDLLRNRDFRNLGLATVTSALGDWIGVLAILALTVEIMQGTRWAAFALGGVMAARVIPAMLLGPIAGVFVDRWNRKRVLIATDIGRGTVMALIPFTDELLTLLLATLVIEVLSTLFSPAKDAIFPRLVRRDQLVAANQVNLVITYGTLPLGGALFAALMAFAAWIAPAETFLADRPLAVPIWFNAASFFVSAPLLARLRVPADPQRSGMAPPLEGPSAWAQLREGLRFIGTHPIIRALIFGVMIAFVSAGVVISLGELFARIVNAPGSGFGILVASAGTGLLVGLLLSGPLTARFDKERLFAPGIGIAGAGLVATAFMPRLDLACLTGGVMGVGAGIAFIVGYTILQERTADSLRGRTFAAFHTGVRVAILSATVVAPTLVGIIGLETPIREPAAGPVGFYPYQVGGVRLTLMFAGLLALAGAVVAGRWLQRSLGPSRGSSQSLDLRGVAPAVSVRHGLLIVFEGGDGAGKSTQIRLLRNAVERAGRDAVVTREPGGTPLGETLREVLLRRGEGEMSPRSEALLYAAARAQHVDEVIAPALEKGAVVLCDRYVDSSIVYQGSARGLGPQQIAELNRWATGRVRPDLVVLLDVDPRVGLDRLGGHADRLEGAGMAFHEVVNSAFRRLAQLDPDRYLVIDATLSVEEVHRRVRDAVLPALGARPAAEATGGADAGSPPTDAGSPPTDAGQELRLPRAERLRGEPLEGEAAPEGAHPSRPGDDTLELADPEVTVELGDRDATVEAGEADEEEER